MLERTRFQTALRSVLDTIDPEVLSYDESEFWMIRAPYEYLEFYAMENRLLNTAVSLRLVRGLHNGTHRKSSICVDGVAYRLPYVIHCLLVCRMLADLHIPLPREDLDVLLAAALCHDVVEDIPLPHHGKELHEIYGLNPRVYETVLLVSKRKDFTSEEEKAHFHGIEANPLALLIKLSDRSNNVEDLYNMKYWKVHEYVAETENLVLPMCAYGLEHYPELRKTIAILQDKIHSLTLSALTMVDRCEAHAQELRDELAALKEENARLRALYRSRMDV